MIEKPLQAWRALAPRERRLVAGAGAFAFAAAAYLLLLEPAWQARAQLQRELPVLRGQLAQMNALAGEAIRLAGAQGSAAAPQALRVVLETSVRAAGLGGALAALNAGGELIEMRFSGVSHAAWLAWLDTTLRETRLRVADLSIWREPNPGIVSVRLVLEFPRREPR